jgi:hypothetical protein
VSFIYQNEKAIDKEIENNSNNNLQYYFLKLGFLNIDEKNNLDKLIDQNKAKELYDDGDYILFLVKNKDN